MPVYCFICKKLYSTQSTLNRHMRNLHKKKTKAIEYEVTIGSYKCLEGCNTSFKCSNDLLVHLINQHSLNGFQAENKNFSSFEDFEVWLDLEKESKTVDFVKSRGSVRYQDGDGSIIENTYYDCNRSGNGLGGYCSKI